MSLHAIFQTTMSTKTARWQLIKVDDPIPVQERKKKEGRKERKKEGKKERKHENERSTEEETIVHFESE